MGLATNNLGYYTGLLFSCSVVADSATAWTAACQASLSFPISGSLLKLISIEAMMPSNRLILFRPLLLLPSIFPGIRVFSNELALHIRRPNDWSFSFGISPSNEYSGLISFRIDWFELLAVQGLSRIFSSTTVQFSQGTGQLANEERDLRKGFAFRSLHPGIGGRLCWNGELKRGGPSWGPDTRGRLWVLKTEAFT